MTTLRSPGHPRSSTDHRTRIVFDIGTRIIRAGFAGSSTPRASLLATTRRVRRIAPESFSGLSYRFEADPGPLWDADSSIETSGMTEDLLDWHLQKICNEYLVCETRVKAATVAENAVLPMHVKYAISRVLLGRLNFTSVEFIPAQICALVSAGCESGIVVDIGWHGTTIVPVSNLRAMMLCISTSPLGSRVLVSRTLDKLTSHFPHKARDTLEGLAEEILTRGGIFCDLRRSHHTQECADVALEFRGETYTIPAALRSSVTEILFMDKQYADTDEVGLGTLVAKSVLRAPMDTRRQLLQNVVVVGGAAMIPGLRSRLREETSRALAMISVQSQSQAWQVGLMDADCLSGVWRGASLTASVTKSSREITRDAFLAGRVVPDWSIPF
jgi:actin-related protein 10